MGKRLVSTIGVLSFFIYTAAAQEQVITIEDLFQLADQNSKSIQLHSLAIDETTQAVEVAKNAKLPSIRAQVDLNYIGDGCMTDRDFSNGIHADMPHFTPVISGTKYNNALYIMPQSFIHNVAIPVSFLRFAIGNRRARSWQPHGPQLENGVLVDA